MVGARLFQALSDPTRLKIMSMLADGPMIVSRMVKRLGCAQPAVSRHLRVLKDVTLIRNERRGKEVEYSLNLGQLAGAAGYLQDLVEAARSAAGSPATKVGGSVREAGAETIRSAAGSARPQVARSDRRVPEAGVRGTDTAEPALASSQPTAYETEEPLVGWAQQARPLPETDVPEARAGAGPKRVSAAKPKRKRPKTRPGGGAGAVKSASKTKATVGRAALSKTKRPAGVRKSKPKAGSKRSPSPEYVIKRDQDTMDDFLL